MHEMSLMRDLLEKINLITKANEGARPVAVTVKLGAMSHISAGHFREHFDEAIRGTPLEKVSLSVIVSEDLDDPRAQDILLESVELEEQEPESESRM